MFKDRDAGTITPEEVERTLFELKSEEHKTGTIKRQSARRTGPFVANQLRCHSGDVAQESELFGHEKGPLHRSGTAKTKEACRKRPGGPLILDEIGDIPLGLASQAVAVLARSHDTDGTGSNAQHKNTPPPKDKPALHRKMIPHIVVQKAS